MIDIRGLDKAKVLAALYNFANPLSGRFKEYKAPPMTQEESQEILDKKFNIGVGYDFIDCIKGRALKLVFSGPELDVTLYEKFNGKGAAEEAIALLQKNRDQYHREIKAKAIDIAAGGNVRDACISLMRDMCKRDDVFDPKFYDVLNNIIVHGTDDKSSMEVVDFIKKNFK